MSNVLAKAKKGIVVGKHIYVLYGPEGVGKSTFANGFPNSLFLDLEKGTRHLNTTRLTMDELGDYQGLLKFIETEVLSPAFNFSTLVIDSLTALETLMSKHICGTKYKTLGDIPFGNGTTQLVGEGTSFMELMRKVQEQKQCDVIILAHTRQKDCTDAYDNATYSRYIIQCNEKLAEKIKSMADNVFFCKFQVNTFMNDKTKKMQAISDGTRVMYTEHRAGADAKNRLNLPYELPLSYDALQKAIAEAKPRTAEELVAEIKALILKADKDTSDTASKKLSEAGTDVQALTRIKAKLATMVAV